MVKTVQSQILTYKTQITWITSGDINITLFCNVYIFKIAKFIGLRFKPFNYIRTLNRLLYKKIYNFFKCFPKRYIVDKIETEQTKSITLVKIILWSSSIIEDITINWFITYLN